MKKIVTIAAIALIGIGFGSSCTKKSDSPSYTLTASVGGTAYSGNNCYATSASNILVIEGISGTQTAPTYPYLAIWIPNWTGNTGTFNFDSTFTNAYAEYLTSSTAYKLSSSGSVTLTAVSSSVVSGTFSFTATDGTAISSGKFTAKRY